MIHYQKKFHLNFINGCSTNERISKFKEILKEMIIQKNNINKELMK